MRKWVQAALRYFGYQLVRNTRPKPSLGSHRGTTTKLAAPLIGELRPDHPRLTDLRERYGRLPTPFAAHPWWTREYLDTTLDFAHFRGDNVYVWQTRHMAQATEHRYFLYAQDVAARDRLQLFRKLDEDGAFGCFVFRSKRFPALSRDLLDSVNELNFLDRHMGIATMQPLRILDIGAGYGRLAHRTERALVNLTAYYCTDAIPESTFLCQFYLQHRSCAKAHVVAADRLAELDGVKLDLAINVHSFSEMSRAAIEAWLDVIRRLETPRLFVVPNDPEAFLTMEADGTRRDFLDAIESHGFRLVAKEPAIADDDVRELVGVHDHLFLFERSR